MNLSIDPYSHKMDPAVNYRADRVIVTTPIYFYTVSAQLKIFMDRMQAFWARKYNLKTQMGNQGASGEGTQLFVEWVEAGIIGDVHTVHAWTNRPVC